MPALFVLSLIILSILGIFNKLFLTLLLSIISAYVFIIMMASIFLSIQKRYLNILVLPLTFCALHFGFGIGFISGTVAFVYKIIKRILKY